MHFFSSQKIFCTSTWVKGLPLDISQNRDETRFCARCVWSSKWPRAKSIIIPKWLRLIDNWWFCNLYKCKPSLLWILPFCETYWSDSILILKDIVVDWFLVGTFGFFNVTLPIRRVDKCLMNLEVLPCC